MAELKKNLPTLLIGLSTVILGGIAIFTAYRLYQIRTEPVAPTAPQSIPQAEEEDVISCQQLSFSLTQETPTPTESVAPSSTPTGTIVPSSTPTATLTPSATPTATLTPTGTLSPTNTPTNTPVPTNTPESPTPTVIAQATVTPTSGQLAQATPTDEVTTSTLPDAGTAIPSVFILALGTILLIVTFALAL